MRFFSLALVATAALAGSAQQTQIERVQATEFGATVLADLQDRLNVADPVSALREFIEKIRTRISEEGIADAKQQDIDGANFAAELGDTDTEVDSAIAQLETCTGEIAKQQSIVANKIEEIINKKIQIRDTEAAIAYNEESIEVGDALRKENQDAYDEAAADAAKVKAAVEKIIAIESASKLHANQHEADTLKASYEAKGSLDLGRVEGITSPTLLSVNALSTLQSTAASVTDPTAQSFIQLAALSAQAFGGPGGSIDELRTLLQHLVDEVDSYTALLGSENTANAADWATLKKTMEDEIADWQADLIRLAGELTVLRQELQTAREALTVAIQCYNAQRTRLRTLYAAKAQILISASDTYSAFLAKEALRAEELETLQLIYEIIKDKLEDATTNIKDNVDQIINTSNTTFADHCHCDHACQVFEDCCPKCDFDNLPNVPSKYDNSPVVYEGGEKELPSRDSASLYSTYYDGQANGFHF